MKKQHVTLTDDHRTYLQELAKKGNLPVRIYKRATALLELDRGRTFTDVAQTVGVVIQTTSRWAKLYQEAGLDFLTDKPRPGRPIEIDGTQRAKVTALACREPPEGHADWLLRLLADKTVELGFAEKISYGTVRHILKKRA